MRGSSIRHPAFRAGGVAAALLLRGGAWAADGPPLLPNGALEAADPADSSRPACWDRPDGLGVRWEAAPDDPDGGQPRGKSIRMDTSVSEKAMVERWRAAGITNWDIPKPADTEVAATYGLSYYSDAIPVKSGQAYRVTVDFKAPEAGEGGKVWVRGYGEFHGEKRRRYETVVFCRVPDGRWTTISQVFHPTKHRPEVAEMRVMLYAYWPPGVYWFDNVRIDPVSDEEYEQARTATGAR